MMQLPTEFQKEMEAILGAEEYQLLAEALASTPSVSIRLNPQKTTVHDHETLTQGAESVPWCAEGYYLPNRPQFTFDPLFHAGCYYVQEASSMFLAHVLRTHVNSPVVALDLCAAPGGKSTLALSCLPTGSLLVANEVVRQRANILSENITKWGNPNSIVTNNYAADFQSLGPIFDLIVCDAPCSGEGMFRKDPATIGEWSLDNVDLCWRRQRDIVADIWPTLKPGGLLVYSTCTYNPLEDDDNVAWMVQHLGAEHLSCQADDQWNLDNLNTHFYPHRTRGEGFFISLLRKPDTSLSATIAQHHKEKRERQRDKKASACIPQEVSSWLSNAEYYDISTNGETISAFPQCYKEVLRKVRQQLHVVSAGIELATIKGKNLRPSHSLAMSTQLHAEAFPRVEVDYTQAIAYLRTEAIQLPADTPTGHVLITHRGHPLGFAKNIGNRANNLYPAEWRIRSTYIPTK